MKNKGKVYIHIKSIMDIFISFIIILLLSWFIILLTLINFVMAHGRAYYLDERVGYHGKKIKVLKFTSMKKDAQENPRKYLNKKQMKAWKKERKVENDPRVTKFGGFLRKTSLDELPQLFNILIGTISFVGPRPITEEELLMHYKQEEREKLLSVKPGLTGLWACSGRNNIEYKDHRRQEIELEYIDKFSFKTDVMIFLKTFIAVFRFKDAK